MYATWENYNEVTKNGLNTEVLRFQKPGLAGASADHDEWDWRSSPKDALMVRRVGLDGKNVGYYFGWGSYGARPYKE